MWELVTGIGLAAAAGLNAYIPLLLLGLLARYSDLVALPESWQWLTGGWTLGILALLLAVEFVADKIPAVDHVNDILQTVVRPTAGGLVFGAGSGAQTAAVTDPGEFFTSHQWVPVACGLAVALAVHGAKALARPVVNTMTGGVGAPVVSTAEDVTSASLSVAALLLPALVLVLLGAVGYGAWTVLRRRRARAAAPETAPPPGGGAQRAGGSAEQG
ncbi:membrane protein [Pilimelia terevasa]|uniref:Membrane protein n=1 Tax=Pilimelia terevasa TaxID=53372 RepID=A0A8J3BPS0_9ACTN|nr:DUF4126 domain-containing protein [Pilimelia terevasa]GGK19053.1 membrane protein [Pilimelia terevasa]